MKEIKKKFVFEGLNGDDTTHVLFRVNEDGSRSIALLEDLETVISQVKIDSYNKGYEDGLADDHEDCEARIREETLKEVAVKIDKLPLYGTTEFTGNKWAYLATDIHEALKSEPSVEDSSK